MTGSDNVHILQAFEHQQDGSWRCIEAVTIETADATLSIEPGMTFVFGRRFGHLDVAEYLEQLGAQFGS